MLESGVLADEFVSLEEYLFVNDSDMKSFKSVWFTKNDIVDPAFKSQIYFEDGIWLVNPKELWDRYGEVNPVEFAFLKALSGVSDTSF